MSKPLDELYFVWLYNQVGDSETQNPARTYWRLLKQLFTKEFIWFVENDDNRIEDGKELRFEFVDQSELNDVDSEWLQQDCSMLELFIGLSRRLAFEAEGEPRDWFWHLVRNLNLQKNTDDNYNEVMVEETLNRVIWRTYEYDGTGGLFPLKYSGRDQRKVELWYQLSEYLLQLTDVAA